MRQKGTRKSSYLKRRSARLDRLFYYARRFGRIAAAVIFVLWLGSWFVLSGGIEKTQRRAVREALSLSARAGFSVENILVEGRVNTDPEIIRGLVNMNKGDPIFAFDPAGARRVLEKISWVRSARVERRLPDTIYIGLTERVPLALWQKNDRLALIGAEGEILTDRDLTEFRDLVVLTGADAPDHAAELLLLLEAEPALHEKVEAARRVGGRRWDLVLQSGVEIKLPEKETGFALRRMMAMDEEDAILDKDIVSIDLRSEDRIIVRPRNGQAQSWQAGFENGI